MSIEEGLVERIKQQEEYIALLKRSINHWGSEVDRLRGYLEMLEPSDVHPGYLMCMENGTATSDGLEAWLNKATARHE